ncbi:cytochrome c maturation protein CcmE [Thermomicrobium roseum]|jgi:cytochrome c-type biogenesis protein CcmE|uniref:Cytochrome c-type biogenesis protein CycJ n=1 Tax=Thermomicrobium roseum (strain ATCC 27502 / DSM 5159 / P-2) TaxID=309801 RepID=B9L1G4_THERP|nr:cytochrome c maturation protein CcmE [Thermomicrobium roseum]ACM05192.1 cytochrome c-type biogenesis protein CycJ [Thermomicrobium roseum DSM 5159]MBO9404411.1 cytochrome c maturation protein CcmE [Thermomicrobium sp.]
MSTAVATRSGARRIRLDVRLLVLALVMAGAVGYLMYTGLQGTAASYFVTVSELQARASEVDGRRVRVGGDVVTGSIVRGGPGEPIHFRIGDGTSELEVVYSGVLPDIFAEGRHVIVEGLYRNGQPVQADSVLTQCPSRFEAAPTASSS